MSNVTVNDGTVYDGTVDDVGTSAAREWAALVNTALLGTDRRPLPPPAPGWEPLVTAPDDAVELLNRAVAVATARRAGVQPAPPALLMVPAPADSRPMCSVVAAGLLTRMSRGEHDVLLPEWFSLCQHAGLQLPGHLVPSLLLRSRRQPAFDLVVRAVVGERARWLAEAMPELGIRPTPAPVPADTQPFLPPAPPVDSGAVVTAITATFLDHLATWAAAPQLRLAVAALDPAWLPALVLELNRAPFNPVTERTRVDLLGLAQMRRELHAVLQPDPPIPPRPADSPNVPAGTRVRLQP